MKNLVVFTGAGISAESGLGTFRDSGGLWDKYQIEEVATPEAFKSNPKQASKILGKYERTSRFNNATDENKDNDAVMLVTSSITDEFSDMGKSKNYAHAKDREGVSEKIQRMKKSVSRNSLSRLGQRTYTLL